MQDTWNPEETPKTPEDELIDTLLENEDLRNIASLFIPESPTEVSQINTTLYPVTQHILSYLPLNISANCGLGHLSFSQITSSKNSFRLLLQVAHNYSFGQLRELIPWGGNITKLNCQSRNLLCVPRQLFDLTNLQHLNLSGNKLIHLPDEILDLDELTSLDLSYNQLTSISKEIRRLPNLTTLSLSHNNLKKACEICLPNSLRTLDISHNQWLKTLPKPRNLTKLIVTGSPVEDIIDSYRQRFPYLEIVGS